MNDRQDVVVRDIQMSFGSMVVFIVKWSLAAIPALIIFWILVSILGLGAWAALLGAYEAFVGM